MSEISVKKKIPVIIDCDPGYDDALALVFALGNRQLDVLGLMATAGNIAIERTYKNAIRITRFLEREIKVGKGVSKPLLRDLKSGADVHSVSGLAGVNIPEDIEMPMEVSSIEMMKMIINKSDEKITLITIGPLTNVALLFITYPEVKANLNSIVMMGGAAVGGNVTATAEFNIYADAEAAKIVFESGVPIVMAGLDVTNDFQIYEEEFEGYKQLGKVGVFTYEALFEYYKFYKTLGKAFKGPAIHDMLPVAYVINPKLFQGEEYHIDIECKGEFTYGQTVVDFNRRNSDFNVKVLKDCDREAILNLFVESIHHLNN